MSKLNGWALEGKAIVKDFKFKNFKGSIEFVNGVAELSEKMSHHPDILIIYDQVRISLTTHSEGGITEKDLDLAEEIDKIS